MLKKTYFTNADKSFTDSIEKNFSFLNTLLDNYKKAVVIQCNAVHKLIEDSNLLVKQLTEVDSSAHALSDINAYATKVLMNNINSRKELATLFMGGNLFPSSFSESSMREFQNSLVKSAEYFTSLNPNFANSAQGALSALFNRSNQFFASAAKSASVEPDVVTK